MPKEFKCPNCGAPLDYKGGDELTMRCPFCGTSVIVPEELRSRPAPEKPMWQGFDQTIAQAQKLGEIKRLADAGQLIEAIKLYRETFGVGLAEAKQAVEDLAAGRPVQISQQTVMSSPIVTTVDIASPATPAPLSRGRPVLAVAVGMLVLMLGLGVAFFSAFSQRAANDGNPIGGLVQAIVPAGFASEELHFGEEGTGAGHFEDIRGIAVDPDGRIYVAEYQGGRVQVFDADGQFITQWKIGDKNTIIPALAADHSGHIFVVHDSELFMHDAATGDEAAKWAHPDGWGMEDIAATPEGGIVAFWYKNRDDIVRFNNDGEPELVIPAAISTAADDTELGAHVAVDGEGNIYALGEFTSAVFKFSPEGKFLNRFGGEGDDPGQFRAPGAIAIDGQGRIYISDFKGIQVFNSDGRYLDVFDTGAFAYGLTFDDSGYLYATEGKQVVKYKINQ